VKRALAIVAALIAIGGARAARAGGVIAIADGRVAQYREALDGAQEAIKGGAVIDPNAADAADQLKRADPSVILAIGQKALSLARASAPQTPTVFCMVLGAGATSSRTVTGVRLEVAPAAQLALLKQVDPAAHRVGVIYDPRASAAFMEEAIKAAGSHGVTLVSKPVGDAREVRAALGRVPAAAGARRVGGRGGAAARAADRHRRVDGRAAGARARARRSAGRLPAGDRRAAPGAVVLARLRRVAVGLAQARGGDGDLPRGAGAGTRLRDRHQRAYRLSL